MRIKRVIISHLFFLTIISVVLCAFIIYSSSLLYGIEVKELFNIPLVVCLIIAFTLCGAYAFKPYGLSKYLGKQTDNSAFVPVPQHLFSKLCEKAMCKDFNLELIGVGFKEDMECDLYETGIFYNESELETALNNLVSYIYGNSDSIGVLIKENLDGSGYLQLSRDNNISMLGMTKLDFYFSKFINTYFRKMPDGRLLFLDINNFINITNKQGYTDCKLSEMSLSQFVEKRNFM